MAADPAPFRCFGGILVEPHESIDGAEPFDVIIVCDLYTPITTAPREHLIKQDEEIVDSNDNSGGLVVLAVDDEEPEGLRTMLAQGLVPGVSLESMLTEALVGAGRVSAEASRVTRSRTRRFQPESAAAFSRGTRHSAATRFSQG